MNLRKKYYFSEKTHIALSPIHGVGRFVKVLVNREEIMVEAGGDEVEPYELNKMNIFGISFLCLSNGNFLVSPATNFNITSLNHSCQPNLKFKFPFWRASLDIIVGTELTTDYETLGYPKGFFGIEYKCFCGSSNCRRRIVL